MKKAFFTFAALLFVLAVLVISGIRFDIPVEKLKPTYANAQSRFVVINGLSVHYRDEGKGFPLLLLHAAPSSLHTFDRMVPELSGRYRVIRLDLPGYGLTGPDNSCDYTVQWYVRFLESFLDALHVDACYAAGNSFGGRLAAELAYVQPRRVKKLVLIDADGYPVDDSGVFAMKMARSSLLRPIVRYVTPRFFVAANLKQVFGPHQNISEQIIDRYYQLMLRAGNRDTFIALSNRPPEDGSGHFKMLKIPTLILWGGADTIFPVRHAELFRRDIPGSRVIVYDGAGHLPQEVVPEKMAADLHAFL